MPYLLDSHTLVWFCENSPRLSARAKAILLDPDSTLHYSTASIWELSIKQSLGKMERAIKIDSTLIPALDGQGLSQLFIENTHVFKTSALPWHHRDPFDRMLAAQCLEDKLTIISCDGIFDTYGIKRIW
jgi:PIN domain nuclease of toxin-antitoxin system